MHIILDCMCVQCMTVLSSCASIGLYTDVTITNRFICKFISIINLISGRIIRVKVHQNYTVKTDQYNYTEYSKVAAFQEKFCAVMI